MEIKQYKWLDEVAMAESWKKESKIEKVGSNIKRSVNKELESG